MTLRAKTVTSLLPLLVACGRSEPAPAPAPAAAAPAPAAAAPAATPAAPAPTPAAPAAVAPAPAAAAPASPTSKGRFVVTYERSKTEAGEELRKSFAQDKAFDELAVELSKALALPHDVPIAFADCGEPNAFWSPDEKRMTMCYELIAHFAEKFADHYKDDALGTAVGGATLFTLFHELGHAVVTLFDLPITGKEEDAVDQLATYMLAGSGKEGVEMAIAGAEAFILDEEDLDDLAMWGEHSLSEQRFFNVLCWIHGSAPEDHKDLVGEGGLPEERAERCPEEWDQLSKAWERLLAPHVTAGP